MDNGKFHFPEPIPLTLSFADMIEQQPVDERFYIKTDRAQQLLQRLIDSGELSEGQTCVGLSLYEDHKIIGGGV